MPDPKTQRHIAVDEPIINLLFEEPTSYWVYDSVTGMPLKPRASGPVHRSFRVDGAFCVGG